MAIKGLDRHLKDARNGRLSRRGFLTLSGLLGAGATAATMAPWPVKKGLGSLVTKAAAATPELGLKDLVPPGFDFGTYMPQMRYFQDNALFDHLLSTMSKDFNLAIPNAVYPHDIFSGPWEYEWGLADQQMSWMKASNIQVRGHPLVDNFGWPEWMAALPKNEMVDKLLNHTYKVASRYKDWTTADGRKLIKSWVVINEAFKPWGSSEFRDDDLIWSKFVSDEERLNFMLQVFNAARAADPQAELFYNDYINHEWGDPKTQGIYDALAWLKARGAPVDAVGMQCHIMVSQPPNYAKVGEAMRNYGSLGLDVQITEMTCRFQECAGTLEDQANIFAGMTGQCVENRGTVRGQSFWGFDDETHWIQPCGEEWNPGDPCTCPGMPGPSLLDRNFKPKPAYFAIEGALQDGKARYGPEVMEFIYSMYEAFLGAGPDNQEASDWLEKLNNGLKTGADFIKDLLVRPEFVGNSFTDEGYVDFMFRTVLGRDADPGGRDSLLGMLAGGSSREDIATFLTGSPEFASRYRGYWMKAA